MKKKRIVFVKLIAPFLFYFHFDTVLTSKF